MKYDYILFDLDGTISESGPGITKAMQYGLTAVGIEENDSAVLHSFIGPPLNVQIKKIYGLSDKDILAVITKFREQYDTKGVFDSSPYEGIKELLDILQADGATLAVASSKPLPLVEKLLQKFHFTSYFSAVVGSDPEDEMKNKADFDQKIRMIRKTLAILGVPAERNDSVLMVGDKNYDIIGAKSNHIRSAGVLWGYGSKKELEEAGADFLFDSPGDLKKFLLT